MGRTISSSSSSSSSSSYLLSFFLLFVVLSLFIGVYGKTEPESGMDYTSAFVTHNQKRNDSDISHGSSKYVSSPDANNNDGDDGTADNEEEEEEDEEDASGDGEVEEGEEEEEEEVEGEYEGEERDEYEDELKALAESHEAMSKDETKNEGKSSNVSSKASPLPRSDLSDAKNFESQENVLEKQSDEDDASNEAIIDELPIKHEDKEVADLLKYKKEKSSWKMEEEVIKKKKKKRVPTVKKELSTQKEIILAGNETQVPKNLVPSEETFNVLNEDNEPVQRRDLEEQQRSQDVQAREKIFQSEKTLDKRNNVVPWQLKPCKTKNCEIMIDEKENLYGEGVSEAKNLPNSRKRYHDEMEQWEEIHGRFPTDSQTGLEEKEYDVNSLRQLTMDDTQKESKKQKKKKKKKKKKLQQRRSTTTMSPSTTIRPTTETNTETTTAAIQWHLLAEKWFGLSLQQDGHPESENVAKIQYSVTSKPNPLSSSIQQFADRQDTTNDKSESETEKPPSFLLPKERNLDGRSNVFPFGKTDNSRKNYELGAERLKDYETAERAFQRLRFGELVATSPRDFSLREKNTEDYRDDGGPLEEDFVRNGVYGPPNQDFGMSRNWPDADLALKYDRPWKGETRSMSSRLSNDWVWRQGSPPLSPRYDVNFWPARGNAWQPIRNYWPSFDNEEADEAEINRNWRARDAQQRWRLPRPPMRQRQRQQRLIQRLRQEKEEENERLPYSPWDLEGPDVWPMSATKPFRELESPWPRIKDHIYESMKPAAATTSTTSSVGRLNGKGKVSLPKISMTTWNSLTSDPATWPYKSSGTMPWPKDENGKSYNPNADLVRKLGLDKEENTIWSTGQTEKPYNNVISDRRSPLEVNVRNSTKDEGEVLTTRKFKLPKDRTNFGIYDLRSKSAKLWGKQRSAEMSPPLESSNDNVNVWYREDERRKLWSPKDTLSASLPELRTVGGWVMPADKSTWTPYRYDSLNPYESVNEDGSWSRGPMNVDIWDRKGGLSRMNANIADPWSGRFENDRWNKENYAAWDRKRSFDKGQPEDVDALRTNRVDTPPVQSKMNQSNVAIENSKEGLSLDKSNHSNASYERSSSWPLRWKQFSYHRVTALPTSKPGTITDSASKSRNAFVAVSVISSPKYLPSRNEIEGFANNRNHQFEKQLEDLRRQNFWSTGTNTVKEPNRTVSPTIESTTVEPTLTTMANSTFVAHRPEEELPKSATKKYEMHLRI